MGYYPIVEFKKVLIQPALLFFEARRSDTNLKTIYKVNKVPCDTQMRKILDEQDPASIEPLFSDIFVSSSN